MKTSTINELKRTDEFILKNTLRNSYQYFKLSRWTNFILNFFNYPYYNFIVEKNGNIIACFPVFLVKSKLFGNHFVSVPFASHGGGIVVEKEQYRKRIIRLFLKKLEKIAEENKVKFIQVRGPKQEDINDFLNAGFVEPLKDYNFLLDLNIGIKELRKNLNKKLRNRLKNAEKSNITIEVGWDAIDDFYNLYLKTMKTLGSPPHSKKYFIELSNTGKFWIYIAKYNNKIIAASTFLINSDYATWQDNASLPKYKNLNATTLLLWDFIVNHHKNIKTLDLGTSREDSSHYNYKKKWGASIVRASKLYYYFGDEQEIIDVRSKKYAFFSAIWRMFIPKFLTKYIGPSIRKGMGY